MTQVSAEVLHFGHEVVRVESPNRHYRRLGRHFWSACIEYVSRPGPWRTLPERRLLIGGLHA
jgi:hypothetical protein